jgi:cyclin M-like protein
VVEAGEVQRGGGAVTWLWAAVITLVVLGSLLALSEASLTRITRVRALALREEGRRNAELLVAIQEDPPRYLNSVYLTVMLAQNGSAILVAILAEQLFEGSGVGVTLMSVTFTLLYFVVVEAMSKTFAVLHSDRVALATAPLAWFLGPGRTSSPSSTTRSCVTCKRWCSSTVSRGSPCTARTSTMWWGSCSPRTC